MSINKVAISGNLTRDGELRQTQSGTAVLRFTVAVNDRRKGATGEWEDKPNYIDCTMFGQRADSLAKYLMKGVKVCATGKLDWNQWEQNGEKRSKLAVIVEDVDLMSKGNNNAVSQPTSAPQAPQAVYTPQPQPQPQPQAVPQQQQAFDVQAAIRQQQAPNAAYADADIPF